MVFADSFENNETLAQSETEDIKPITRNGSSGQPVQFLPNEYQPQGEEIIVVNETPSHFMDLLCKSYFFHSLSFRYSSCSF